MHAQNLLVNAWNIAKREKLEPYLIIIQHNCLISLNYTILKESAICQFLYVVYSKKLYSKNVKSKILFVFCEKNMITFSFRW